MPAPLKPRKKRPRRVHVRTCGVPMLRVDGSTPVATFMVVATEVRLKKCHRPHDLSGYAHTGRLVKLLHDPVAAGLDALAVIAAHESKKAE
jgi:hypothetical protein